MIVTAIKKIRVGTDFGIMLVECESCLYTALVFAGLSNGTKESDNSYKVGETPLYTSYDEALNEGMQIALAKENESSVEWRIS
jgi:hypothetical protein